MSYRLPTVVCMEPLSPLHLQVLAFEHRRWRFAGAREQAITDEFGMSATRYQQILNHLLDEPAALVHDPVLVKRLRRLRERRQRTRSARQLA
jgi:hypothetical protein